MTPRSEIIADHTPSTPAELPYPTTFTSPQSTFKEENRTIERMSKWNGNPTRNPTVGPSGSPTVGPIVGPSGSPTVGPTVEPTTSPFTASPSTNPFETPIVGPSGSPTVGPTDQRVRFNDNPTSITPTPAPPKELGAHNNPGSTEDTPVRSKRQPKPRKILNYDTLGGMAASDIGGTADEEEIKLVKNLHDPDRKY